MNAQTLGQICVKVSNNWKNRNVEEKLSLKMVLKGLKTFLNICIKRSEGNYEGDPRIQTLEGTPLISLYAFK